MILRFRSAIDVKMPRGDVALDLGEPELELIQPRRVGGREVQLHTAMLGEERPHRLRLVGQEIVENDVDLAPWRLRRDDHCTDSCCCNGQSDVSRAVREMLQSAASISGPQSQRERTRGTGERRR